MKCGRLLIRSLNCEKVVKNKKDENIVNFSQKHKTAFETLQEQTIAISKLLFDDTELQVQIVLKNGECLNVYSFGNAGNGFATAKCKDKENRETIVLFDIRQTEIVYRFLYGIELQEKPKPVIGFHS